MPAMGDGDGDDAVRAQAIDWLARLRAEPDAATAAAFERWYIADPSHADAYDRLLDSWETTKAAGQFRDAGIGSGWIRISVAVAAILLVVLAAGLALSRPPQQAVPATVFAAAPGAVRTVALADGSRVTLDAGSIVRVALDPRERRLELVQGRARFEVAHEPGRPFLVRARLDTVIARGTIFDVDLRDGRADVRLLEGRVEVRTTPGSGRVAARSIALTAGQQLDLAQNQVAPVSIPPGETGWPAGLLVFEDAPLSQVVAAINRTGSVRIALAASVSGGLRFTGTLPARAPDRIAATLAATFALDAVRDTHGNYLLVPRK